MINKRLKIAFFGSSLVSAYWNGAATYYRGIVRALHEKGYDVTFFEPDAYDRQAHRDIEDPEWASVIVYEANPEKVYDCLDMAAGYDVIVKASGVGVFDELLEREVINLKQRNNLVIFWDVDAPATLDRINHNPRDYFNNLVPKFDLILTYGGGDPVSMAYEERGAKKCIPIYNALDTATHFPVNPHHDFIGDLSFLGNRLPDREKRVDEFFLLPASIMKEHRFILGGSGWADKAMPSNVKYMGHVYTKDHNAFNCTPKAVLNISRDSMASFGFSPATRLFEAAGAAACIITDYWEGIDQFLTPGEEILVASNGRDVADILSNLSLAEAADIGQKAYKKIISNHTYAHRAEQLDQILKAFVTGTQSIMI